MNPAPSLFRQRFPFLPLLFCAIAGVLSSSWLAGPGWWWAFLAGISLVCFLAAAFKDFQRLGFAAFCAFLISAFSLLHLWQQQDSTSSRLATWLNGQSIIAEVTGTVSSEPRVLSENNSRFEVQVGELKIGKESGSIHFRLPVNWRGKTPAYGDRVRLSGLLTNLSPPRNPGQFNYAAWWGRNNVFSSLEVAHEYDGAILAQGKGNPIMALALRAKTWMGATLGNGIDDPTISDLILAMVLGDTSSIPQRVQEEFRGTGTYHLFSVSGLHVGILAVILWQVLKLLRIPRPVAALLSIPLLFFYALMTGFQPASVRSTIMASILLIGLMAERRPQMLNNLSAAAFLILLLDTNQLFNAGFQLSFAVVAAILLFSPRINALLEKPFLPDPFFPIKLLSARRRFLLHNAQEFAALCTVSLAAWIGSLPLMVGYFHLVSLAALPANLVAVPISFGIMAVSVLSLAVSLINGWLGMILNQCNWLLAKLLLVAVHFFASLPGSYFYVPTPQYPSPAAEVVIFDLGAGGACWLQTEGKSWLFDCGPLRSHDSILLPFLRSQGLRTLDGLLLTHGDAGHLGGAAELIESTPPALIVDSPLGDRSSLRHRFHQILTGKNLPKSLYQAGDQLNIAPQAIARILYPTTGLTAPVADDKAIVVLLEIGHTRILMMSDSGLSTEEWLLAHAREKLSCDILIKGAHHSGISGSLAFLEAAHPRVIVATAAEFPATEQIPPEWAQAVAQKGIRLFRQDVCGAVTVKMYSRYWEISGFLNNQAYQHLR